MAASRYTHVDVEPNPNSLIGANQVFRNIDAPFAVARVRLYDDDPAGRRCAITGWSSAGDGSPATAYAVRVEDSSAGVAVLVYGGDWGVRLKPADAAAAWDAADAAQWGETHLVLSDLNDLEPS